MSDTTSMKKAAIIAAFTAAAALGVSSVSAENMEKCKVVNSDGMGIIKAQKADCAGSSHSCAGNNAAGDPESWIYVPEGQCEKINAGNFENVSDEIMAKLELAESQEESSI